MRARNDFLTREPTPVDGENFEKVLDILVEHPQLVQNLNELADELRALYNKLTCKIFYISKRVKNIENFTVFARKIAIF